MTISTTSNREAATGNGSQTTFTFDFKAVAASHVTVYQGGTLLSSGYTVALNDNGAAGGTVEFDSAPANLEALLFLRVVPYTQETNLREEENLDEEDIEQMDDLNIMAVQQVKEITDRNLTLPVTTDITASLADPTLDKQVLAYDDATDTIVWTTVAALYSEGGVGTGNVTGPASSVDSNLAAFDGVTGRLLKDSGFNLPDFTGKAFQNVRVNSAGTGIEAQSHTPSELDIASGVITPTGRYHTVDTEGDISSDALTSIATTNFALGDMVTISAANGARDVVLTHSAALYLMGAADYTLDDAEKTVTFVRVSAGWREVNRGTLSGGNTRFASSAQNYTVAGLLTLAHGLSSNPRRVWGEWVCDSAEANYSVNDRVQMVFAAGSDFDSISPGVYVDGTNVYVRFGSANTYIVNKTTGTSTFMTATKWDLIVYADSEDS